MARAAGPSRGDDVKVKYSIGFEDFKKSRGRGVPFREFSTFKVLSDTEKLMGAISSRINYGRNEMLAMPVHNFYILVKSLSDKKGE